MRRSRMPSRQIYLFLALVFFVWGLSLINVALVEYDKLYNKEQVSVSNVLLDTDIPDVRDIADGPKETKANLSYSDPPAHQENAMDHMMSILLKRIDKIENKLDFVLQNRSHTLSKILQSQVLSEKIREPVISREAGVQHKTEKKDEFVDSEVKPINSQQVLKEGQAGMCKLSDTDIVAFPYCLTKIEWMIRKWKSDVCYELYGVDGSFCSIRRFLSEVESWCPLLPGRKSYSQRQANTEGKNATFNFNLEGLMNKLQDSGSRNQFAWIRTRIARLWDRWVSGAKHVQSRQPFQNRTQKKVIVHLGSLTNDSGFQIPERSTRGGPLGELVQWSDILAALYISGHELTISSEVDQLERVLASFPKITSQCQTNEQLPFDIIYTDIMGLIQFKAQMRNGYATSSCLLRIIDSFGTEPSFNFEPYATSHNMKTSWGMKNLNPAQFFTMFPHSPDNSFMGFVIENHLEESALKTFTRKNQAVVYGKAQYMWQGKDEFLKVIKEFVDIEGTVFIPEDSQGILPAFVNNHGLLNGAELQTLLRESKLFIGLGFPYEGPAPLEAIAQGAVFINPKFDPPHNSANNWFFRGKPTLRKVTSQHPYAEDFIGEPHVFTVDISNPAEVKEVIHRALKVHYEGQVSPYLPYEYTEEGMIERLIAYTQHQDFCAQNPPIWPPKEAVEMIKGQPGVSCKDVCSAKNRICEPAHFRRLNTETVMKKLGGDCTVVRSADIFFPAYNPSRNTCILQAETMLFSCVGEHSDYARLCPCRDYVKGQTALCSKCL